MTIEIEVVGGTISDEERDARCMNWVVIIEDMTGISLEPTIHATSSYSCVYKHTHRNSCFVAATYSQVRSRDGRPVILIL